MFLEDFNTAIGNIITFKPINGELLQWPAFKPFVVRYDGIPLRLLGLDKTIAKKLGVNVTTAPVTYIISMKDREDQASSEIASACMQTPSLHHSSHIDLRAGEKRKETSKGARTAATLTYFSSCPLTLGL